MRFMLHIILIAILGYGLLVGILYGFQRHLIYHPDRDIDPPREYGLKDFDEHFTATSDNETIQLWYRAASDGFPTIVYFHGNSYNLGDRAGIYAALTREGFGLLALSYRGYGESTGTPSEEGIYIDARTAINYLANNLHVPPSRTLLYGESLGTGVAVQMGIEYDVGGIVLQSPYTAVSARAAEIYSFIPVSLLIKDKFATLEKIPQLKAPLMVLHGEVDQIIPITHGKAVFAAATCPKEAFFFPGVGHNDFDSDEISAHVLDFAKKYNLITP